MQSFAASLYQNRQNRQTMQQQVNNNVINNAQTPYRQGFPMTPTEFSKKFGAPIALVNHNRLTDNNGTPLPGFRFSKTIVNGLDPEVFASKALSEAGFTHEQFAKTLIEGDSTLQIVCHEGSNDIFIAPTKSTVVEDVTNTSTILAMFSKNDKDTEKSF
jgi:hypothetical protein